MQKKNRNGMLKHCFMIAAVLAAFLFAAGCNPPTGNDGKTGNEGKNGTEKEGGTTTPGGEQPGGEQPGGEQPGGEQPGGEQPGGPGAPPAVDETEVKLTLKDVGTGAGLSGFAAVGSLGTENYATGVPVKAMVETSKLGNAAEVGAKLKAAVTAKIAALKTANAGFDFKVFKNADGTGGEATADADFVKDQDLFIGKKAAAAADKTPKIVFEAITDVMYLDDGVGYETFTDVGMLAPAGHTAAANCTDAELQAKLQDLITTKLGTDYKIFSQKTGGATVVEVSTITAAQNGTTLVIGKKMPTVALTISKATTAKTGYAVANFTTAAAGGGAYSVFDAGNVVKTVYIPTTVKTDGFSGHESDYQNAVDTALNALLKSGLASGKTVKLFEKNDASTDRPTAAQIAPAGSAAGTEVFIAIAD